MTAKRQGISSNHYGEIDDLQYQYKGNRLEAVAEHASLGNDRERGDFYDGNPSLNANEYTYDPNGNMITDSNKGLKITYNLLNLPTTVFEKYTNEKGEHQLGSSFIYDATGNKLRVIGGKSIPGESSASRIIDYIGNFIYEDDVLQYIITEEGRAVYNNGTFTHYEYHIKDHLGNTRVAVTNDGTIKQTNSYYPFGMLQRGKTQQPQTDDNKYLYNGKELDTDFGLYDYGARFYDAQLGRWHSVDPMIESHFDYTPYAYVYNNPIKLIDPFGMDSILFNNAGHFKRLERDNEGDVFVSVKDNEFNDGVIKYNKKGELKNRHKTHNVDEGAVEIHEDQTEGGEYGTLITINDNSVAEPLFEYLGDKSGVEFSMIEFTIDDGLPNIEITTSHANDIGGWHDNFGANRTDNYIRDPNITVTRHTHNHPNGSSTGRNPSPGDIRTYGIWTGFDENIIFRIRFAGSTEIVNEWRYR